VVDVCDDCDVAYIRAGFHGFADLRARERVACERQLVVRTSTI
jgi:hypothetical protein